MVSVESLPPDPATREKVIGVIGGMGPEATVDFFRRIVLNTSAKTDQDHLHILIDNNPKVPNRHAAIAGTGPTPEDSFSQSAQRLQSAGVDFLAMPCNTAHAFEEAITASVDIPFISIVKETCNHIQTGFSEMENVGLLAADGCLQAGLYDRALETINVNTIKLPPQRQRDFMLLVHQIKSTGVDQDVKTAIKSMAGELIQEGAQGILAGCTEVPLVLTQSDLAAPLIDSTEVLARRCVLYARGSCALPVDLD